MSILGTAGGQLLLLGGSLVAPLALPPSTYTVALANHRTEYAAAQPVFQRTGRGTTGPVPFQFAYTGTLPAGWQLRVVNQATGATVVTAAPATVTVGPSSALGTLTVPLGMDYVMQFVDPAGAVVSATTQRFGVGIRELWLGQSNMVNTLGGDYGATVPGTSQDELTYWEANKRGTFMDLDGVHGPGYNDGSRGPGGTSNAQLYGNPTANLRLKAAALTAKHGRAVPVQMIVHAWNSTSLAQFLPGAGHWQDLMAGSGTTAGTFGLASPPMILGTGDYEIVHWHQGEADQAQTVAQRITALGQLAQAHLAYVAQFGRAANDLLLSLAVLGNYDPGSCPGIESIRVAAEQFVQQANAGTLSWQSGVPWTGARVGWTTIDLVRSAGDGLHFGGAAEQRRSFRRAHQTALWWLGCAAFDGGGPSLPGTYTRSGLAATLDVTSPSGTPLTAGSGAITGWYANTAVDFTGTDIAVTVALSGGKLVVTFPNGTTFPVYLKHLGGRIGSTAVGANGYTASCNPDVTNLVRDTASYPTGATGTDVEALGLPLRPSVGALTIS